VQFLAISGNDAPGSLVFFFVDLASAIATHRARAALSDPAVFARISGHPPVFQANSWTPMSYPGSQIPGVPWLGFELGGLVGGGSLDDRECARLVQTGQLETHETSRISAARLHPEACFRATIGE